jgi:hypothetical protein
LSWTAYATSIPKADEVEEKVQAALDAQLVQQPFDSWDDDIAEQQELAKKLASEVAASGNIGDGPFNVTLNGHRQRSTNDPSSLSVSVSGSIEAQPTP